ncbi:TPA: ArsR/SmtB family transcription factor [Clostridium sporogenes]
MSNLWQDYYYDFSIIRILWHLFPVESSAGDLVLAFEMSQSAISHQLRVIKVRGFIKSRREGKSIIYFLEDNYVRTVILQKIEHMKEQEEKYM